MSSLTGSHQENLPASETATPMPSEPCSPNPQSSRSCTPSRHMRSYSYSASFLPDYDSGSAAVNALVPTLTPYPINTPTHSRHKFSFPHNNIQPHVIQQAFANAQFQEFPSKTIIFICNTARDQEESEQDKEHEEDVSEEFVTQFNAHIGNAENSRKAQRLLTKMRGLGNLEPSQLPPDIPAARMGLCLLARLNQHQLKTQALDSLYAVLYHDKIDHNSAFHLVPMAIQLMHHMDQDLFQTETIDIQIKIVRIYALIAEQLQQHYAKKHTNGITKELKIQLSSTAHALQALNTQEDPKLSFFVKYALEGIVRLKDNRTELFDLLERFYHTFAAIVALRGGDVKFAFGEFPKIFKDLDPHSPRVWYNGALIIKDLGKKAIKEPSQLLVIQSLLNDKHKIFNWKFTYAAIEVLSDLALLAEDVHTRKAAALMLCSFVDCRDLATYRDFRPIKHFKSPLTRDPNIRIRQVTVEHLTKISNESQDKFVKEKVRKALMEGLKKEGNEEIQTLLKGIIPGNLVAQKVWIGA